MKGRRSTSGGLGEYGRCWRRGLSGGGRKVWVRQDGHFDSTYENSLLPALPRLPVSVINHMSVHLKGPRLRRSATGFELPRPAASLLPPLYSLLATLSTISMTLADSDIPSSKLFDLINDGISKVHLVSRCSCSPLPPPRAR